MNVVTLVLYVPNHNIYGTVACNTVFMVLSVPLILPRIVLQKPVKGHLCYTRLLFMSSYSLLRSSPFLTYNIGANLYPPFLSLFCIKQPATQAEREREREREPKITIIDESSNHAIEKHNNALTRPLSPAYLWRYCSFQLVWSQT